MFMILAHFVSKLAQNLDSCKDNYQQHKKRVKNVLRLEVHQGKEDPSKNLKTAIHSQDTPTMC